MRWRTNYPYREQLPLFSLLEIVPDLRPSALVTMLRAVLCGLALGAGTVGAFQAPRGPLNAGWSRTTELKSTNDLYGHPGGKGQKPDQKVRLARRPIPATRPCSLRVCTGPRCPPLPPLPPSRGLGRLRPPRFLCI